MGKGIHRDRAVANDAPKKMKPDAGAEKKAKKQSKKTTTTKKKSSKREGK
jgi:hypothetical protein